MMCIGDFNCSLLFDAPHPSSDLMSRNCISMKVLSPVLPENVTSYVTDQKCILLPLWPVTTQVQPSGPSTINRSPAIHLAATYQTESNGKIIFMQQQENQIFIARGGKYMHSL